MATNRCGWAAKNLGGWVSGDSCNLYHRGVNVRDGMNDYYIYMMANRSRTLYTGVTNNLRRRVYEHKHMLSDGFARRYLIDRLVYYETTNDIEAGIRREKQIKSWVRRRKVALIESVNPEWKDLGEELS